MALNTDIAKNSEGSDRDKNFGGITGYSDPLAALGLRIPYGSFVCALAWFWPERARILSVAHRQVAIPPEEARPVEHESAWAFVLMAHNILVSIWCRFSESTRQTRRNRRDLIEITLKFLVPDR